MSNREKEKEEARDRKRTGSVIERISERGSRMRVRRDRMREGERK